MSVKHPPTHIFSQDLDISYRRSWQRPGWARNLEIQTTIKNGTKCNRMVLFGLLAVN